MIENRQLYLFEETDNSEQLEPVDNVTEPAIDEVWAPKFLYQTVIAILCLVIAVSLCRQNYSWANWLRERFHYALNISSQSSFGRIWNLPFFQSIVKNSKNLIRLEKVTRTMAQKSSPLDDNINGDVFKDSIWPVPGNIIKEYGWGYNWLTKTGEFSPGAVIEISGQSGVMTIATGEITLITQNGNSWSVEIDHGSGWSSFYHPLTKIEVRVGQIVQTGQVIGSIGIPGDTGKSKLSLEIKHWGQSVDPRSVIR